MQWIVYLLGLTCLSNIEMETSVKYFIFYTSQLHVLATWTLPLAICTELYKEIIYIEVMGEISGLRKKLHM